MADSKEMDNIDEKSKLNTESDTAKIKFQQSSNGEAKIEMPDNSSTGYQCGLTKEELMKYANDPFWVFMRRLLLVLFWLLWIAMLVGAVIIIIVTPKCAPPKEPEWYESSPIYELRVDEFSDGNKDQKSDLRGIIEKLPYLEEISVSAIVIDSLFDPVKPRIIDPKRGSKDDFKELASKIKAIVKVPLHQMELNTLPNEKEFANALTMWLNEGAAGFVFDGLETQSLQNKQEFLEQCYNLVSNYSTEGFPRVNILSSYKPLDIETSCTTGTSMIMQYDLTKLTKNFNLETFFELISTAVKNETTSCRKAFVTSNGDISPLLSRFQPHERDRIVMFMLLSDLTPTFYFGEEYAKEDNDMPSQLRRGHGVIPKAFDWSLLETFKAQKNNNFYKVFTKTSKLRQSEYAIRMGATFTKTYDLQKVGAMARIKKGNPGFLIVTNFDGQPQTVDLTQVSPQIPEVGQIDVISSGVEIKDSKVNLKSFELAGQGTVVIQFVPSS